MQGGFRPSLQFSKWAVPNSVEWAGELARQEAGLANSHWQQVASGTRKKWLCHWRLTKKGLPLAPPPKKKALARVRERAMGSRSGSETIASDPTDRSVVYGDVPAQPPPVIRYRTSKTGRGMPRTHSAAQIARLPIDIGRLLISVVGCWQMPDSLSTTRPPRGDRRATDVAELQTTCQAASQRGFGRVAVPISVRCMALRCVPREARLNRERFPSLSSSGVTPKAGLRRFNLIAHRSIAFSSEKRPFRSRTRRWGVRSTDISPQEEQRGRCPADPRGRSSSSDAA